jgi:predicted RNA-binding Zn-ribbon protein involved in translation (DUF1610 family)
MDNVFRIKKTRDTDTKTKEYETVSGTLDSIHQNMVSKIRDANLKELIKKKQELEQTIDEIQKEDVYKITKLQDELRTIQKRLDQRNPIKDYYIKNADIILKYYSSGDKLQSISTTPADQNTFVKYLTVAQDTSAVSKKDLYDEFTSRMKLNTGNEISEKTFTTEHCDQCNIAREELSEEGILVCPKCGIGRVYVSRIGFSFVSRSAERTQ